MEAIRERLTRLETSIGSDEEDEERSIIDRLKEAVESAERAESLYISLAAESVNDWLLSKRRLPF